MLDKLLDEFAFAVARLQRARMRNDEDPEDEVRERDAARDAIKKAFAQAGRAVEHHPGPPPAPPAPPRPKK